MSNPLLIAPGGSVEYDPSYGEFVILVTGSEDININNDNNNNIITTTSRTGFLLPYSYISDTVAARNAVLLNLEELGLWINELVVSEIWGDVVLNSQEIFYVAVSILTSGQIESLILIQESSFYTFWNALRALQGLLALSASEGRRRNILDFIQDEVEGSRRKYNTIFQRPFANSNVKVLTLQPPDVTDRELQVVYQTTELIGETFIEYSEINELFYLQKYCYLIMIPGELFQSSIKTLDSYADGLDTLCLVESWFVLQGVVDSRTLFNVGEHSTPTVEESNVDEVEKFLDLNIGLNLLDYYAGFPCSELDLHGAYITGDAIIFCFVSSKNLTVKAQVFPEFYTVKIPTTFGKQWEKLDRGGDGYSLATTDKNRKEYVLITPLEPRSAERKSHKILHPFTISEGPGLDILLDFRLGDERIRELEDNIVNVVLKHYPKSTVERITVNNREVLLIHSHRLIIIKTCIEESCELEIMKSSFPSHRGWITDEKEYEEKGTSPSRNCFLSANCLNVFKSQTESIYYDFYDNLSLESLAQHTFYGLDQKIANLEDKSPNTLKVLLDKGASKNILLDNNREEFLRIVAPEKYN